MRAASCRELIEQYEREKRIFGSQRLVFSGVEGYDVYNTTPDFEWEGKHYIAGRVEKRDTEFSSVRFFERTGECVYRLAFPGVCFTHFQDPFVTKIGGELILGGVQILADPLHADRIFSWHTLFYRGKGPESLRLFAEGPSHMKDIRLVERQDGSVGIFTRPQGGAGGLGKIGYLTVPDLDGVSDEAISRARIYKTHFLPGEWGGANEIHPLRDGRLGVLGHIACRDGEGGLHYHSMCFLFDPEAETHTPVRLLARRRDVTGSAECKRPGLLDVLFTGGLVPRGDGRAELYTGVSDCMAYRVTVADPFAELR